ncbi:hypothetical protein [Chitinolyticbacter meiyuanensis]|uniref:hypothetical protein n=1 Tax=Chitinolyticbacter meiyuanensis TaxID=682798 RepID=UPI0011E5E8AD|nr:hypothetical protein [Chitinolyticbacter meiyuanensis]
MEIIELHESSGLDLVSGVVFTKSGDAWKDQKKHTEKLFRWLDEDREQGSLPANFIPTILSWLPMDSRLTAMNELLCGTGMHVELDTRVDLGGLSIPQLGAATIKEANEATTAIAQLVANHSEANVGVAIVEISEAIHELTRTLKGLMSMQAIHLGEAEHVELTTPAGESLQ